MSDKYIYSYSSFAAWPLFAEGFRYPLLLLYSFFFASLTFGLFLFFAFTPIWGTGVYLGLKFLPFMYLYIIISIGFGACLIGVLLYISCRRASVLKNSLNGFLPASHSFFSFANMICNENKKIYSGCILLRSGKIIFYAKQPDQSLTETIIDLHDIENITLEKNWYSVIQKMVIHTMLAKNSKNADL